MEINGQRGSWVIRGGQRWSEMARNAHNWSEIVRGVQRCSEGVRGGLEILQLMIKESKQSDSHLKRLTNRTKKWEDIQQALLSCLQEYNPRVIFLWNPCTVSFTLCC